jgi:lysozyme
MEVSAQGLALIRAFEGFSASAYHCPAGYLTIGYGHVIGAAERDSLRRVDDMQAETLLRQDTQKAGAAVLRLIHVSLTQGQFDALVSFTFNLGSGALQRSTLRRVINRGEHGEVPAQMKRWVWAGGRRISGLLRRREAEARLYMQVADGTS